MSKAILVMDMPESCFYCDCCHIKDYYYRRKIYDEKFCGIENMEVTFYHDQAYYDNYTKPDWCPLKPLPEKEDVNLFNDRAGYSLGWNACIDEILGATK